METITEQAGSTAPLIAVLPGRTLREARERLGLTIADVALQTKLASRQIEALEQDDFHRLPELPFVRGFVRSYAKILGLEAQPLLDSLPLSKDLVKPLVSASVEVPFPTPLSRQQQNLIWLGAALLLAVLVVVVAVWNFTAPPTDEVKAELAQQVELPVSLPAVVDMMAASPVADVSVAASSVGEFMPQSGVARTQTMAREEVPLQISLGSKTAPAEAKGAELRMTFGEEAWTEVRDKNGNLISSQVNKGGSELRLSGQAPLSLVVGRAASSRVFYKGKQIDLAPFINETSDVARLTLE
ncbi:MAG: DUF4115 domain-containing protein [Gallionella sp.]|nr:DUF4115 domain-containing protein [Gallionella sp.]